MWNISFYRLVFCRLILFYVEVTENNNMNFLYKTVKTMKCSLTRYFLNQTIINCCGTTYKQPMHNIIMQNFSTKLHSLNNIYILLLAKFVVLKLEFKITILDVSSLLGSGLLYNNLFRPTNHRICKSQEKGTLRMDLFKPNKLKRSSGLM